MYDDYVENSVTTYRTTITKIKYITKFALDDLKETEFAGVSLATAFTTRVKRSLSF